MMKMRNALFSLFILTSCAHAQKIPQAITDSLAGLRIEKIQLSNKTLSVTYKDEKVGDLMAVSVVQSICGTRYLTPKGFSDNTFDTVKVYNHWEMQGFEFNITGKQCDAFGQLPGDEYNLALRNVMKTI